MRAKIILTDFDGNDFVGEVTLTALSTVKMASSQVASRVDKKVRLIQSTQLDFELNFNAFMKRIGVNKMSGPVKLTAVVAYLAKGSTTVVVKMADVKRRWNSLKSSLGKYNPYYTVPAKANAWIDPVNYGTCRLRQEGLEKLQQS